MKVAWFFLSLLIALVFGAVSKFFDFGIVINLCGVLIFLATLALLASRERLGNV